MKTYEREFFVDDEVMEHIDTAENWNIFATSKPQGSHRNSIKITYERFEKTVTISEDQFDEALITASGDGVLAMNTIIKEFKKELFKEGKCQH